MPSLVLVCGPSSLQKTKYCLSRPVSSYYAKIEMSMEAEPEDIILEQLKGTSAETTLYTRGNLYISANFYTPFSRKLVLQFVEKTAPSVYDYHAIVTKDLPEDAFPTLQEGFHGISRMHFSGIGPYPLQY